MAGSATEEQCADDAAPLAAPSSSSALLEQRINAICRRAPPLPSDDDHQGSSSAAPPLLWQDAYSALHAEAARNPSRARLLVFDTTANGGYADRLTGLMTALLLAVLSQRAIVLDWPGHELALSMPRLGGQAANDALLKASRAAPPEDFRRISWYNANRKTLEDSVTSMPLDTLWPERVVSLKSNRGFTQQILRSPMHREAARKLGLGAANAQFGCLFNFLFSPTDEALAPLRPFFDALADPRYMTVGVHVRTGDAAFSGAGGGAAAAGGAGGAVLYASHAFILEYAEALATRLAAEEEQEAEAATASSSGLPPPAPPPPPRRTPRLLLLGDSMPMRQHALSIYGEEKLLLPNGTVGHIAKPSMSSAATSSSSTTTTAASSSRSAKETALLNAIGEHWLYSSASAFVYSSHSGFPRTAAARALLDDRIHTCFHYTGPLFNKDQPTKRECTGPYSVAQLGERHAAGL